MKNKYVKLYDEYNTIKEELKNNYGDEKEKQRKLDLLKYELGEINLAKLKENEEESLVEQRKIIMNSEKIFESLEEADNQINEVISSSLNKVIRSLEKIEDIDEKYKNVVTELKNTYYVIDELNRDIQDYKQEIYFDEGERKELEERLDLIYSLKRKYGNTISEILEYKQKIEKEIYEIENLEEYTNRLKVKLNEIKEQMNIESKKMHEIRDKNARILNEKITSELKDLEMKNAEFIVKVELKENEDYNVNGLDNVEFLIKTNVGDKEKPLIKIASGGEMSRIMLAIKNVLAKVDDVPILVFDEIDTGISGVAANKVAEKLKLISKNHQVLIVTHQGVIAARGDNNYFISKAIIDNTTKTTIKHLTEEETLNEIARITTGEVTKISLEHAKELRIK